MKKTRWLTAGMLALCALMGFTACKPGDDNEGPNGPDGPDDPGSQGDSYVDYDPSKPSGDDSFDYDGNYSTPELNIDGKGDDTQWQTAPTIATYGKNNAVNVKVFRGQEALFFLFDVQDAVLLTNGVTNDDAVTRGDSIELYLDTKADGGRAPQSDDFQINLGIHGKTRIMQGSGSNWGLWNGLIDYEVDLKGGSLNNGEQEDDTGYTVEVMVRYRDIMIEKDDTIGVAFGQVDKWMVNDAPAGGEAGPWNWYGWTYGGNFVEPQTIDNYVLLDKDNQLMTRDEQPKPDVTIAGTVKDAEGNPVEGATATVRVEESDKTATTDSLGYFAIADVPSNYSYSVTVEKSGYLTASVDYARAELRAANGGIVLKDFTLVSEAALSYTTLTGIVKNVAHGAVGGATVSVKNTTLTTTAGADGTFTIGSVPANNGDITLVVSKSGYADSETTVTEATLTADGTTALGDVNLSLPWANMGMFAGKSNFFVAASTTLTRTLTGIQMHFEGLHRLSGHIEVYVDTKESGSVRNDDSTAWCFNLNDDGTITGVHYQNTFTDTGLVWTIGHNDSDGFIGDFFIPYGYFPVGSIEVFGIEFGQWSTSASDWDGWSMCPVGTAPVAENPKTWVRVGATNNLYRAENNSTSAALSGNVGVANVTVTANGVSATSNGSGDWSMNVPVTSAALTVTYSGRGYVTKETTIEAGYFDSHFSWNENVTLETKKVTITGAVKDQDGQPINRVLVELVGEGVNLSVHTNEQGVYSIDEVTTFVDLTITFTIEGYAGGSETITVVQLASAGASYTLDKELTATSNIKYVTLKGTAAGIEGALQNVTVSAGDGLTATTGADGTFEIAQVPAVDGTVTLTLAGYQTATINLRAGDIDADSGEHTIGSVYLTRNYTALGNAFGTKSDSFASFTPYVTRGENAFEFKFVGSTGFNGHIEMFIDTKLSSGDGGRNATDFRFDLGAGGTVGVDNFEGPKSGNIDTLVLNVAGTESAPEVFFTLPYAYLGVERTEIVGVTFGQWSDAANNGAGDWDGWNHDEPEMLGVNGIAFVQPERTWDYIRIGVDNAPFWNSENKTLEELNLTSYNLHFGKGAAADSFHAKVVSRDSEGITFEFITLGDFGSRDGKLEAVLLYFDKGAVIGGWDGVDYQIKLVSDGNAYGGAQAWYAADEAHKIGTYLITRENGVTKFTYKVLYSNLGITETEVVGFTLVEGWLTGDNGSDEYGGCLFTKSDGNFVVADAAATAGYIRMKADGTLTTANSNAEVQ